MRLDATPSIEVRQLGDCDPLQLEVTLRALGSARRHRVSMSVSDYQRLTAARWPPDRCMEAVFRFLLEREPKEAILRSFDIRVISRYFPEFEAQLPGYLAKLPTPSQR